MRRECVVRGTWLLASGFTLLEVIAVMVILGLIMGMSGLAFVGLRIPRESNVAGELRRARSEAIQTGRPVRIGGNHAPRTTHVLFLPDGRAIGPGADPLTGAPVDAAH
jgi:prepilin-type N-terminal cleavage/methylation domain-containing protein